MIEIQAVALLNNSEEWTDDVYSLSASVMDGVSTVYFMFTELWHGDGIRNTIDESSGIFLIWMH